MTPALPICSVCRSRDAASYLRVQNVTPGGVETLLTTTCSIKCLLTWTYKYATLKGVMLAAQTKSAMQQFIDRIKGLGG